MNLNRGRELRDGNPYTLPKYGSGPYDYTLLNDKISLRWMLSSNSNFNDYGFEMSGNTLFIGNFYDSPSGDLLTFERLD